VQEEIVAIVEELGDMVTALRDAGRSTSWMSTAMSACG
jgi:hypothetical protein